MNREALIQFAGPYYAGKDLMHDGWHIELVERWVERVIALGNYAPDRELLMYATWFHGFIWSDEVGIRRWLAVQGVPKGRIEQIVKVAWESQRPEIPETLEGKILHDAHVLEGGTARGQSLKQTLEYLKTQVIDHNHCCLPETIPLCEEMNDWAKAFVKALEAGIE